MPVRIVLVHDEPQFAGDVKSALTSAGHQVATFIDPLAAWGALGTAQQTDILITRVQFSPGLSNGLALARMARLKCPPIRVLFIALAEFAADNEDLGTFLPTPVSTPEVVEAVERLLKMSEEGSR